MLQVLKAVGLTVRLVEKTKRQEERNVLPVLKATEKKNLIADQNLLTAEGKNKGGGNKMKQLMENWRKFLNEGIDPRIQKQIDNLPENIMILISDEESLGVMISYENTTGEPSDVFGLVEIENMGGGPCSDAWKVMYAEAQKGWGPLLYEVAIEWASQNGGGLTSDRRSVSKKAAAVWDKYLKRTDVSKNQLDTLNPELDKLTPEDPSDDCVQNAAIKSSGEENWMNDPLSKAYFKSSAEVISALRKKGKLEIKF